MIKPLSSEQYNIDNNNDNADLIDAAIQANIDDIATNTSNISSNDTDIATNASDIATNAADIATETTNRIGGDNALQSQIDTLVVTGVAEPMVAVYKTKDITNTNDYIISYGTLALFDEMRINVEVLNTNTGNVTVKLNTEVAKPVRWRTNGVDTELTQGMMDGINELQYDASAEVFLLLTRDGVKQSNPITAQEPITQVGGDTYKDLVVDGFNEIVVDGDSVVQEVVLGDAVTSVISDGGFTLIDVNTDGTNELTNPYDATNQTFNITTGDKIFALYEIKNTSVGDIRDYIQLRYSDGTFDEIGTDVVGQSLVYGIITATKTLLANIKFREGNIGQIDRKHQMLINLTALNKQSYTQDEAFKAYASNGYLPNGINNVNGDISVVGKNKLSTEDLLDNANVEIVILNKSDFKLTDAQAVSNEDRKIFDIKFLDNVQYVFSYSDIKTGSNNARMRVTYTDGTQDDMPVPTTVETERTFTSDAGKTIDFISYGLSVGTGTTSIANLMARILGTDDTFEQQNKTTISLPQNLKSLPNGVVDTYNVNTGEVVRNVAPIDGDGYALLSGDITELTTGFVNVDVVRITKPSDWSEYGTDIIDLNESITTEFSSGFAVNPPDQTINIGTIYSRNTTSFGYVVEKGTYADLASAQADLTGTKLIYQLETPNQEQHESQQFLLTKGGTIEQTSAVVGEIEYTVNLNQPAQVNSNSEAINRVEIESDNKAQQNGGLTPYSVNGTNITVAPASGLESFTIRITSDISSAGYNIIREGISKPLNFPDGTQLTELVSAIGFYKIYEEESAFTYAPNGGARIKKITHESHVFPTTSTSEVVSISNVDSTKTVIRFKGFELPAGNSAISADQSKSSFTFELAADGNSVTIQRGSTTFGSAGTVYFDIVEYELVRNITRGTVTSTAFPIVETLGSAITDISKTELIYGLRTTLTTWQQHYGIILNSTQLEFGWGVSSPARTIQYELIEFY